MHEKEKEENRILSSFSNTHPHCIACMGTQKRQGKWGGGVAQVVDLFVRCNSESQHGDPFHGSNSKGCMQPQRAHFHN